MLFSEFIKNYRDGLLDQQLGEKINEVVEAVEKIGRKGTLDLKIELKRSGGGQMSVTMTTVAKPPINNTVSGDMFVDKNYNLQTMDPCQQALELKIVEAKTPERKLQAM